MGRYPVNGTPGEKRAWAKADTARRTNAASTGWGGEDTREDVPAAVWLEAPETRPQVKADWEQAEQAGLDDVREMRLAVARHDAIASRDQRAPRAPVRVSWRPTPRAARKRRSVRTGPRRARAPASKADDPEPPPDLAQLAAASKRLWAHVRRREARHRLAA